MGDSLSIGISPAETPSDGRREDQAPGGADLASAACCLLAGGRFATFGVGLHGGLFARLSNVATRGARARRKNGLAARH